MWESFRASLCAHIPCCILLAVSCTLPALFYWQDQFDTIDLSDNDIRKVEGFPLLRRLKMLIINSNRVW